MKQIKLNDFSFFFHDFSMTSLGSLEFYDITRFPGRVATL